MNRWKILVEFINSHEIFTKKDLKNNINGFKSTYYNYVIFLLKSGFLDKPDIATYKRKLIIPKNITITKIKKVAYYSDIEKYNFIKSLIRKEKLINLANNEDNKYIIK